MFFHVVYAYSLVHEDLCSIILGVRKFSPAKYCICSAVSYLPDEVKKRIPYLSYVVIVFSAGSYNVEGHLLKEGIQW